MPKFLAISSALAGATIGFITGLAVAFLAGFHEFTHVFSFTVIFAAAFSVFGVLTARKISFHLKEKHQIAFRLAVFCIAIGSAYTFIRVVV